jgi:hypothetical protein
MDLGALKVSLSKKVIEAKELDKLRENAWEEVHFLQKAVWIMENDLHIGDEVEVVDGEISEIGRITDIFIRHSKVMPIISKIKKDGSVSSRTVYVWTTSKIKKIIK